VLRVVADLDEVVTADGTPPVVALVKAERRGDTVDVLVGDDTGGTLLRLAGVRFAALDAASSTTASPRQLVHEIAWRPLPDTPRDSGPHRGAVLVGPDSPLLRAVRAELGTAGMASRTVAVPPEPADLDATDVLVVPPLPPPGSGVADAAARSAWLLTETAQRIARGGGPRPPRLWCLTSGVRESREARHLAHAPLWGLGRVISGEHPELWGGIVDLDPDGAAAGIADLLRAAPAEDVISLRDGVASVARLARPDRPAAGDPLTCRPDGTYLVTGGLGVLGLQVARWLAERGARRIVLLSRRSFPARTEWDRPADEATGRLVEQIQAVEALGVTVRVVPADIADPRQTAAALDPDALGLAPIRGVVHAAGVLDNRMLHNVDEASLRAVMRPKVDGAWTLHTLFPPGSLDFLVLFSSCGQLLGMPGQATYGCANAFLDALAVHRAARGPQLARTAVASQLDRGHGDTTSFGWTSWRGQGMAVNDIVDSELRARGVADISVPEAFGAWELAARYGGGYFAVLRTVPLEPGAQRLPVLCEVVGADGGAQPEVDVLAGLPADRLGDRVREEVRAQIADEMRLSAEHLDPRRPLGEQGLDSVLTLAVRRRLERRFGQSLPAALLWQEPTVSAIADHLTQLLSDPGGT
jgi:6-methylsalicylic acid synthase